MGDQQVHFAKEATRWLGVWIDSALTLVGNRRRCINRARQAEARIRRLVNKYGIPPTSARNLQTSIIQGTMLYAAELTRRGEKKMESDYQLAINRMERATTGTFRSTPLASLWRKASWPRLSLY